ncbi:MAG: hypothetical protein KKA84_14780 [Bacteroidetes bacterium]|nr:hypothetical protein [Bacteroidota bacterium]
MKLTYLFILLSFLYTINAQDIVEKVNIDRIVKAQIEAARAKQKTEPEMPQDSAGQVLDNQLVIHNEPDSSKQNEAQLEAVVAIPEIEKTAFAEIKSVPEKRKPYVARRIMKPVKSSGIVWKFLLLVTASAIAVVVVYFRRKTSAKKEDKDKILKKNIKLMREERIVKKDNPYLNEIRKRLKDGPGRTQLNDIIITKTARDLKISKGEILLANRIHNHEKMNAV